MLPTEKYTQREDHLPGHASQDCSALCPVFPFGPRLPYLFRAGQPPYRHAFPGILHQPLRNSDFKIQKVLCLISEMKRIIMACIVFIIYPLRLVGLTVRLSKLKF